MTLNLPKIPELLTLDKLRNTTFHEPNTVSGRAELAMGYLTTQLTILECESDVLFMDNLMGKINGILNGEVCEDRPTNP